MADNEHKSDETRNNDDQADENTALLKPGPHDRYDTSAKVTGGLDDSQEDPTEQDLLPGRNGAGSSFSRPGLTPAPLKLVPPECIPEQGDPEANSVSSSGSTNAAEGNDDSEPPSFLVNTHPRQFRVVFAGIMLTYFIANFDSTIMASSHPVITSYFHSSNKASWLTTAFLLTSTAFQPLVGRLSDTIGRKPLYLVTMFILAAATAWCALAQSMTSFIAARAVCGLGAGGMMTLGAIAISDCVPIEYVGPPLLD
jgi:hypothetical protein